MGDAPRRSRRGIAPVWIVLAAVLAFGGAAPVIVLAGGPSTGGVGILGDGDPIQALAPPPETCAPDETRSAGDFSNICSGSGAEASAGFSFGSLLPILGLVAAGGLLLLIAAFVVLRRTSAPLVAADPGEWWTCRTCGKNNVLGSARCYACGAWQR